MKKKTPSFQSRRVETPQNGVFYDVPHNGKRKKLTNIPASYLKERAEYAIDQLRKRISIATKKHLTDHKEDALKRVTELRSEIMKAIAVHAKNGLRNQSELDKFCKDVDLAVDSFKSKHKETLHISQRFAEIFLGIEREAISKLFELPNDQANVDDSSEEKGEIQKLCKSATEIIDACTNTTQKARLVKKGIDEARQALEMMMALRQQFTKRQELIEQIDGTTEETLSRISRIKEGQSYFRGLINYKMRTDLEYSANELEQQTSELDKTQKGLEQLDSLITGLKEVQAQILALSGNNGLIHESAEKPDPEDEEATTKDGDEPSLEQEEVPQTLRSQHEFRNFRWKNANQEEAASEVRSRLVTFNPLIALLAETERWHDLRLVIDKMSTSDLRACKLSLSCTGHRDSYFPKKSDLSKACFPECYSDTKFAKLPGKIERGRQAKRLSWTKKGIQYSEIQAQVRNRIFAAWPLLNELYNDEMWTELRYMLERLSGITLAECRISPAAYSQENSPYDNYQEMLRDAFEDAFKD